MSVLDCIAEIGLDIGKDKIIDVKTEVEVRNRLGEFLQKQQRLNFSCSAEEEIDFQGLADYIRKDLLDDVKLRVFGSRKERNLARKEILNKSAFYAKTKTKIAERRAIKMVDTAIEILRKYYRSRINRDLLYIATEIEDTVIEEITDQHQVLSEQIEKLTEIIGDTKALSIDNNMALAQSGQIGDVERNLATAMRAISSTHSLYPYYGYKMEAAGQFISIPLTEEATKLYPPRFDITAKSVQLGTSRINEIDSNILSQSYRHQLPIHMDVVVARKYLGNIIDPVQHEAEEMTGAHAVLYPPAFPEAFPCSICMDGDIFFDYVLMRTKEILDDRTAIITNEEQENRHFDVTLTYMPNTKRFDLNVKLSNPTNAERLNYFRFAKRANEGGELSIKILSIDQILARGRVNKIDVLSHDEEIAFLQKIVAIESYFHVDLVIPDTIVQDDHSLINHIYDLIEHGSYIGHWSAMEFTFSMSEELKKKIIEFTAENYVLGYSCQASIELFNQELQLPIRRKLECAVLADLEKVKRKVMVLDSGDSIKLKFVPGNGEESGAYVDTIASGDEEHSAVFFH